MLACGGRTLTISPLSPRTRNGLPFSWALAVKAPATKSAAAIVVITFLISIPSSIPFRFPVLFAAWPRAAFRKSRTISELLGEVIAAARFPEKQGSSSHERWGQQLGRKMGPGVYR